MGDIEYYIDKGFIFKPHHQEYTIEELEYVVLKMNTIKEQTTQEGYFKQQKELVDGNN